MIPVISNRHPTLDSLCMSYILTFENMFCMNFLMTCTVHLMFIIVLYKSTYTLQLIIFKIHISLNPLIKMFKSAWMLKISTKTFDYVCFNCHAGPCTVGHQLSLTWSGRSTQHPVCAKERCWPPYSDQERIKLTTLACTTYNSCIQAYNT